MVLHAQPNRSIPSIEKAHDGRRDEPETEAVPAMHRIDD
jgi:hypothetical protein